jgi:hypothetical protein
VTTDPAIFQVGDIVEVQMTIEAVKQMKTEKHFVTYQLRSLALLDDSHSQVLKANTKFANRSH